MTEERQNRILVIDDNPHNLALVQGQLERAGYSVHTALSGRAGLEAASAQAPDLVLLDIMMPGLDGYEVCRRLKADPQLRAVPVVMLTALRERADKLRALNAGADDFLSKPVDRVELEARVRACLRTKRLYDELAESRDEIMQQAHQIAIEKSRAEAVLYSMGDGMFTTDLDGRITFLNPSAEAIVGVTLEAAVGEPWREALRTVDQRGQPLTQDNDPVVRVLRSDEPVPTCELLTTRTDGAVLTIGLAAAPIGRAVGRTVGVVAVFRDVTERKRSEEERSQLLEEIARERAILVAVMSSMSDGLIVFDADHRIRYCNAQAAAVCGIDAREMLGRSATELLAAIGHRFDNPETVRQAWEEALPRLDERPSFDVTLPGPPRRDVLMQFFATPHAAKNLPAVGVVLRDVTAERDLVRTKDELVSVVSHELRTPLASLVGFAELLMERDYAEAERGQFLSVMLEEGRRLTTLINDFLDLQRLESGRQTFARQPVNLTDLVDRALLTLGEDSERPIGLDLPEDLPSLHADPDRMSRVLLNLLSNARKYSPRGGPIQLTAREADGRVEVSIRDNGLGLPPEALPRLFEKFYRVDNSDRREITGTGLGLVICKEIVEAHGGRIWAESAGLGKGSTFRFLAPITTDTPRRGKSKVEARPPDRPRAAGGHVLVVEDNANYATWMSETLGREGYSVAVAVSGDEALRRIEERAPDVLLLDLRLTGQLDGWELLAVLRSRPETGALPVVVISAYDERGSSQALNVQDYLVKPVSNEQLESIVRRLMGTRDRPVLVVEDDEAIQRFIDESLT